MVAHWVDWATGLVESWPDDVRDAPFDVTVAEEAVRLAETIPALLSHPDGRWAPPDHGGGLIQQRHRLNPRGVAGSQPPGPAMRPVS